MAAIEHRLFEVQAEGDVLNGRVAWFENRDGRARQWSRHFIKNNRHQQDFHSLCVADFDNDGRLDLFVSNANANPLLFRNCVPEGENSHWVQFALKGTRSNRDAIGAHLRLTAEGRTQVGYVNGGNGFASQSTLRVHFGLADATVIDRLEVRWPSGATQVFEKLAVNKIYDITEEKPKPEAR